MSIMIFKFFIKNYMYLGSLFSYLIIFKINYTYFFINSTIVSDMLCTLGFQFFFFNFFMVRALFYACKNICSIYSKVEFIKKINRLLQFLQIIMAPCIKVLASSLLLSKTRLNT